MTSPLFTRQSADSYCHSVKWRTWYTRSTRISSTSGDARSFSLSVAQPNFPSVDWKRMPMLTSIVILIGFDCFSVFVFNLEIRTEATPSNKCILWVNHNSVFRFGDFRHFIKLYWLFDSWFFVINSTLIWIQIHTFSTAITKWNTRNLSSIPHILWQNASAIAAKSAKSHFASNNQPIRQYSCQTQKQQHLPMPTVLNKQKLLSNVS